MRDGERHRFVTVLKDKDNWDGRMIDSRRPLQLNVGVVV